jgi:hypothetical protein
MRSTPWSCGKTGTEITCCDGQLLVAVARFRDDAEAIVRCVNLCADCNLEVAVGAFSKAQLALTGCTWTVEEAESLHELVKRGTEPK